MGRKKNNEMREKILITSYKLFIEKDYTEITTRQIAQECGIERALLQYYFNKKEDLVRTILNNITIKLLEYINRNINLEEFEFDITGLNLQMLWGTLTEKKKLSNLFKVILKNADLHRSGISFLWGVKDQFNKYPMSQQDKLTNLFINGGMAQLVLSKLDGKTDLSIREIIDIVLTFYYRYQGKTYSEVTELLHKINTVVSPERIQDFISFYETELHYV